jgi:hypothetical protein
VSLGNACEDLQHLFEELDALKKRQEVARTQLRLMVRLYRLGSGSQGDIRRLNTTQSIVSSTEIGKTPQAPLPPFTHTQGKSIRKPPHCVSGDKLHPCLPIKNACNSSDVGKAQLRLLDQAASPILDFELSKFQLVQV